MYRIGRQLAPMQKEPLHLKYSCIRILLFAQKAYSFVALAICTNGQVGFSNSILFKSLMGSLKLEWMCNGYFCCFPGS
jgi:hypothetical protein